MQPIGAIMDAAYRTRPAQGRISEENFMSAEINISEKVAMFSLETFYNTYQVDPTRTVIQGRPFTFLRPLNIESFLNEEDPLKGFPLWAKIWEASYLLADQLAQRKVEAGKLYLEIGCGLGVVGIVVSCFGHDVTMTEADRHALQFARANAQINHCTEAEIIELDWNKALLDGRFDCIFASEIVYHEKDFDPLLRLFKTLLKPEGEVILSSEARRTTIQFYREMQRYFVLEGQKKTLRGHGTEKSFILCRMTPKPD
jgi:2-polyprenyl-3-methyl-5-hydroxy-6-metoxy-1,4-benzoquinol methylase